MAGWLDKAKEAAAKAAEEAKKLAEKAKSADYGDMLNKTKDMATHAAGEAKKAADSVMHKTAPPTQPDIIPPQDNPQAVQTPPTVQPPSEVPYTVQVTSPSSPQAVPVMPQIQITTILAKIAQVEQLLQEIKTYLK